MTTTPKLKKSKPRNVMMREQIAEALGCSKRTVSYLISSGRLPAKNISKTHIPCYQISQAALQKFIDQNPQFPQFFGVRGSRKKEEAMV